jgi:hypothetical protein
MPCLLCAWSGDFLPTTIAHRLQTETEGLLEALKQQFRLSRELVALEFSYHLVARLLGRRIQLNLGQGALKGSNHV